MRELRASLVYLLLINIVSMATRRRIGVSAATTEAARRQLMQPVPCWEKVWVVPTILSGSSSTLNEKKNSGEHNLWCPT